MSMKNILVLIVLMYFGFHDVTQAEIIHGMDIPTLYLSKIVGKWYALAGAMNIDGLGCMTFTVEQNSPVNVTINMTAIPSPAKINNDHSIINTPRTTLVRCILKDNSNLLTCYIDPKDSVTVVVFDADYDSYMAVYVKNPEEEMNNNKDSFFFVVGRKPTLPDGLIEKVKQSKVYQQGLDHDIVPFYILETSECQNEKLENIPAV